MQIEVTNNFVAPFFKMNFVAFLRNEIILSAKTGPQSNLTLLFANYIFFGRDLQWGVCPSGTMQPQWEGPTHFFQLEGKKVRCNEIILVSKTGPKPHMTLLFEN